MIIHSRKNQRLSIIISKDSLSCFYTDLETSEIHWSQDFDTSFLENKSRFRQTIDELKDLAPSRIYLLDDSDRFTLLPNELYSWQSEYKTLANAISILDRTMIHTNRADRDLVCISEKSKYLSILQREFNEVFTVHLSIPLINRVLEEKSMALLYFTKQSFYLTIGQDSLQLHNRFFYKKKEDVLYYLNSVAEHLVQFDTLILAGSITTESQLFHGIKTNFPMARMYSSNLKRNQLMFF